MFVLRSNFLSQVCLKNPRINFAHVEKMAAHAGENDDCVLCFKIFC